MSASTYRCSFTLPADVAVSLSVVAKKFGVSQSAVLSVLLGDSLPFIDQALDTVVTEQGVTRRLIGANGEAIRDQILHALSEGRAMAKQLDWVS